MAQEINCRLGLFIQSPNQVHNVGEERDRLVPNPWATSEQKKTLFERVGHAMAISYVKNFALPLMMPTILYKYLLGEELTFEDLKRVNINTVKTIESIESMEPEHLQYMDSNFTVPMMDGTEAELLSGGRNITLT